MLKNRKIVHLLFFCTVAVVLGTLVILMPSPVQADGVVVSNADSVTTDNSTSSPDLISAAAITGPRVIVEYCGAMSEPVLYSSDALRLVASSVLPRIAVEYATSLTDVGMSISQGLTDTASAVAPRIVVDFAGSMVNPDLIPLPLLPEPTGITVEPANFTIESGKSTTLAATLQDFGGNPMVGKTIGWSATSGTIAPVSGTTDAEGRVASTYTAPLVSIDKSVNITVSFAGDSSYGGSHADSLATVTFVTDTTAPTAPANLTKITPKNDNIPTFTWNAASDATSGVASYEVKMDSGSFIDIGNVTTYTVSAALSDGSHTLYVRAVDVAENDGNANSLTFVIDVSAPTTPTNLIKTTPKNDNTPTFIWNPANDTTSGVASYEVKVDSGSFIDIGNVMTYSVSTALSDGSHTFYVRAKDNAGNIGTASNLAFATDITAPSNTSPSNGATDISLTPTLVCSVLPLSGEGLTLMASQWQISTTTGDYSHSIFDSGTDTTNLTSINIPSEKLRYSTTYYWRVRRQFDNGNWSTWSDETVFTTERAPFNFTPFIYGGAAIFGLALIIAVLKGISVFRQNRRLAKERMEKDKAEIIDMIEKALKDKDKR